jgi:hypothetical protein
MAREYRKVASWPEVMDRWAVGFRHALRDHLENRGRILSVNGNA